VPEQLRRWASTMPIGSASPAWAAATISAAGAALQVLRRTA
jgi:hypothetical protein